MARFRNRASTELSPLSELQPDELRLKDVGSRTLALVEAGRLNVPIAEGWVLKTDAFRSIVRDALPPGHDPASLLRVIHRPAGLERAARARERLGHVPLPEVLDRSLAELAERQTVGPSSERASSGRAAEGRGGFVLRASPTLADDALATMAGLLAPRIWGVRSKIELARAVRSIWALCFDEHTLMYLRGCRVRDVAVAVLIERVEHIVASGQLLTEDPRVPPRLGAPEAQRRVRVARAALGLGAPPSDGVLSADLVRFVEDGSVVEQRTVEKPLQLVVSNRGAELLPNEHPSRPALAQRTLGELGAVARALDGLDQGPRLVEFWVPRRGSVVVSEVRRTRGLGFPEGGSARTIWSRVGLGESLPGVPTPLSASLARAFEARGLLEALTALGAKPERDSRLLARVQGRFYLNLSALVPALGEVPGLSPSTLLDLVRADGLDLGAELGIEHSRTSGSLARLPITVARLSAQQRRAADEVLRFERESEQQRRWLAEMDLGILPDDALKTTLVETHRFFQRTARLLLQCSVAALATHLGLKTVLARSTPVGAERLAQLAAAGVGQLDTTLPGGALMHVIGIAHHDQAARQALLDGARSLGGVPQGPARRALVQFLEAYGERGLREAELTQPRFWENPEPILEMAAAGLRLDPVDPDRRLMHARVVADREIAALEARLPYVERVLVRALVARARELTRLRERMRLWLGRTLGMLRTVVLDVDRRMGRLDPTLEPGAAFYCTFDELVSAVGSSRADLAPIARLRRAAFERDAALPDPPETFQGAPPPMPLPPLGGVVLHGMGAAPGSVIGRARRIGPGASGASRLEPGDVLVLRALDLGLVPLFFLASGVVAELGGPLSHGAVAARECGLPVVVGVPGATTSVTDGERLRVDGDRGVVERLDA